MGVFPTLIMLNQKLRFLFLNSESAFITVATSNNAGEPNAAPKIIFKCARGSVFLVDVPRGQTWLNLKENPKLAVSVIDEEKLTAYHLKGSVTILDDDVSRDKYFKEIDKTLNRMIVNRIVEGEHRGRGFGNFIARVPKDFIVFKVKILEIVEYGLEDIKTRKSTKKKITIDQSTAKK